MKMAVSTVQQTGFEGSVHMSALKDFIQMTIHDPSFFAKSRMEQKEVALDTIKQHKNRI